MMECPLFWLISAQSQALLIQYQWDTYGLKLTIPPNPYIGSLLTDIDKFMRQKPHHPRKVK